MTEPTTVHENRRFDSLTVFQAAPLVWVDNDNGKHPLEVPNFDEEAMDMLDSVREARDIDAEIEVIFEPANTERLSAFLAKGQSPVMHFSGHGHPAYLGIENEGVMQPLLVDLLRQFVAAGTGELRVVFVAACHSRQAGEAFQDAGVRHVVCCRQDAQLRDTAAIVFARNFYRSLALGNRLKESFELARQAVRVSPDVEDSASEMEKFVLLPETEDDDNEYHNVEVFYASKKPRRSQSRSQTAKPFTQGRICHLPSAPRLVLGRELCIFQIIEKLKLVSIVSVTGPSGIGRSTVTKAACNYMYERSRAFEAFYWVSMDHPCGNDCLMQNLQHVYQDLIKGRSFDINMVGSQIETVLKETRALIIFDARMFSKATMPQFERFLDQLILETKYVKAIILCSPDVSIQMDRHHTEQLSLPPLEFKSTILLFGLACPHVSGECCQEVRTSRDLASLLIPYEKESELPNSRCLSRRCSRIFDCAGRGIPGDILMAAKRTTEKEYKELIRIGKKTDYQPTFNTRLELEDEVTRVSSLMILAEEEWDFLVAQDFREKLEELCSLRETLYSFSELKNIESRLLVEIRAAVKAQEYVVAAALYKQLEELREKMQAEQKASLKENLLCSGETVATGVSQKSLQPTTTNSERVDREGVKGRQYNGILAAGVERAVIETDIVKDGGDDATRMGTISNFLASNEKMSSRSEEAPPSLQRTEDSASFTSSGLDGFVGVELSGAFKDYDVDWNSKVIKSKTHLEANLSRLLRYGSVTFGDSSLQVDYIDHNGTARAVARLDCEIEIRVDLRPQDYVRVKDICRKIASLLKAAGASESDLHQLMIGSAWVGSLEVLLEAPSRVFDLLFSMLAKSGGRLEVETGVFMVGMAPAMLVRGPYFLKASLEANERRPDVFLWKKDDFRLLCPISAVARNELIARGVGCSVLIDDVSSDISHVLPTVRRLQQGCYDFLLLSLNSAVPEGTTTDNVNNRASGQANASSALLAASFSLQEVSDWSQTAVILNNLALELRKHGDLPGALRKYQSASFIQGQLLPGSLAHAVLHNNIGFILHALNDFDAATTEYEKAREILERKAPDSLRAATLYKNIGSLLRSQGKLNEALDMFQQAIVIEKRLAPESVEVATSHNNLGLLFEEHGDRQGAEQQYRKALKIVHQSAPYELATARLHNNLGLLLQDKGDLTAALRQHRMALEIQDRRNAGDLPVAAVTYNNIGAALRKQGHLEESLQAFRKALKIQQSHAPDSLELADCYSNICEVLRDQGDLDAAQQEYQRALAIKKIHGIVSGEDPVGAASNVGGDQVL